MNYCIIDDEPIAHRIIEGYSKNLPYLKKVGNCYDVFEAMQLLNTESVDLIFLDINMPELTGFDLLKTMRHTPKVIVTSAHEEYALEGYELNISDYLLKPFSLERFLRAIQKITDQQPTPSDTESSEKNPSFFLKGDKKTHQIHASQILFIEAYGNYTKIYLTQETIVIHEKISSLETLLTDLGFLRVHKSFIVAANKIKLIEGNRITIEEHRVPIGQSYKHNLNQYLKGG